MVAGYLPEGVEESQIEPRKFKIKLKSTGSQSTRPVNCHISIIKLYRLSPKHLLQLKSVRVHHWKYEFRGKSHGSY